MLTSAAQVKTEGNLPDTIEDKILEPHLIKASIAVKKILTPEKYSEVETASGDDPVNEAYQACALAEANLALSYALTSLNMETSGTGILKTKGWDQSRSDLLNQNEVQQLQEHYHSIAMDLLKPYIPAEEYPGDEIKGADYRLNAV